MLGRQIRRQWVVAKGRIGKLLRPSRYEWGDTDLAFIVSTGRTGRQKLASLISEAFAGVDARHEPFPDMFDVDIAGEPWSGRATN